MSLGCGTSALAALILWNGHHWVNTWPLRASPATLDLQSAARQVLNMLTTGTIQLETDSAEIARRTIAAAQCVLIVVDIQEKLLPPIWERERLLRNSQLLIRLAGILKIPAIVSTQYAKGLGETVPEIASLLPDTTPIDKTMFSCFGSDVFCSML